MTLNIHKGNCHVTNFSIYNTNCKFTCSWIWINTHAFKQGNIFNTNSLTTIVNIVKNIPIPYCINPHPEEGMISSIYYGLQQLNSTEGTFIIPVDCPFFTIDTLKVIMEEVEKNPDSVIIPQYQNKSGHPIWIPSQLFSHIPKTDYPGGLRSLFIEAGIAIQKIDVNDPGIVRNINERKDL